MICDGSEAIIKMMNHTFSDWRAASSKKSIEFTFDKHELVNACDRILVSISDIRTPDGKIANISWFDFHDNKLKIIGEGGTLTGSEEVEINSTNGDMAEPLETAFNIAYFKHIVNSIDSDNVQIGIDQSDIMRPLVVDHDNGQFLLAPCRR